MLLRKFCAATHINPFSASEDSLCLFATHSGNRKISVKTIRVYLHGVLHQNTLLGGNIRVPSLNILYHVLRGTKRIQRNSLTCPLRLPITISHLHDICKLIASSLFHIQDKYMFLASCLIALFGLLRVPKYTSPTVSRFDPSLNLSRSDVSFNHNYSITCLRIKGSKTDPFRAGTTVRIAATYNKLCPVSATCLYFTFSPNSVGPLFRRHNGEFLTRRTIATFHRIATPRVPHINTHSFRIGRASAALTAGASDSLICTLGRWSSDCYIRYLRISDRDISLFQHGMSTVPFTSSTWGPDKI